MADTFERLKTALADRYVIERELGSGGMATVYLAEDLKHERKVAVKVLRPDLASALGPERFLREIKIAAQLHHPHILPLHDSGEADGFLFYVMPYEAGQTLREKLAKEVELPVLEAVRVLRDIVDALAYAHEQGVVHRDIKPDNVMLSGRHALVTDFGVAKAVDEATGREQLTTAGVALGTPAYMAPEQASADPHLDHRVDIYAVGAVAYELLTGRPVFMGTTPQMVLSAHMTEAPQPVTKHRDTVSPALESVVMRCLEKKPADRWQSAEELLPHLDALATPSAGMTPTDMRPLAATPVKRRWLVPAALGGVGAVVVVGVLGTQLMKSRPITVTTSNIRAVTTEPGLEWQPALSPDGSQVAFVARRDGRQSVVIRSTRSIAGSGELTPTEGVHDAHEWLPVWSPDGESVRFHGCPPERGCPWMETQRLGGSIRAADLPRPDIWVSWSPDGSRIAFYPWKSLFEVNKSDDSIFTHLISDGTTTLLSVPDERMNWIYAPVWSPDGRWIAYEEGCPGWIFYFQLCSSSIWIVDSEGGERLRVTGDYFSDISPAWLDADHLLFVSNRDGPREVYVVEIGPTGPVGAPRKVAGVTDAHTISYSVAGRKLAFAKATLRQNVWSYPIESDAVSIGDGHAVTDDNAIIEAHDVSPNGRWIVYSSNLRGNKDLYRRPVEGGNPSSIADGPATEFDPRWSPDGTEIAFHKQLDGLTNGVMVLPADGGTPLQVASARNAWLPSWSPSGLDLVFHSNQTGQNEAWVVSREAIGGPWGEATQMTDLGCHPSDWAPDGSGVLCQVSGEIVLVSREGEILWRYDPSTAGLVISSTYQRFSRDGSTIYTEASHEDSSKGIWAIPVRGGEARLVIAYDHPESFAAWWLTVGRDRLYLTVRQAEVDIWVADVEVER